MPKTEPYAKNWTRWVFRVQSGGRWAEGERSWRAMIRGTSMTMMTPTPGRCRRVQYVDNDWTTTMTATARASPVSYVQSHSRRYIIPSIHPSIYFRHSP